MNDTEIMHIALQVLIVSAKLAAPVLITSLVVGFAVSMFQSATQLQEFTLSFVPKVIAVSLALLVCGHWMMTTLVSFTQGLFGEIPSLLS
ncbi:MAG TPA: flagellar biosynthetic protein FliQ [Jatrophihabitans sp.]|nr:flagellar biosynthetic protein FliQ [Jatrophihabitans sp.]